MIRLNDEFPVYLVRNFHVPIFQKKKIIQKVLENKSLYHKNKEKNFNFCINDDYQNFFQNLYLKFYKLCQKKFVFTVNRNLSKSCWAYVSDKSNFVEMWHNHINSSTINAVYYLNIPKKDNVTIDFELNKKLLTYKIKNYDLIIFPDNLNHKPNRCYNDGYRISINMEIICNETSEHIFNHMR